MRIVVTGATGMIGIALIREALKQGHEVCAIVRKNSARISNLEVFRDVKIIEADLSDYSSLNVPDSYDWFFHLAWGKTSGSGRDDVYTQMENAKYSVDAVALAYRMGCRKFIGAGSQAEYGPVSVPLTPDTPVFPESGYGIAKLEAGLMCRLKCKQLGMMFNWVRILSVYGKNDNPNSLISYLIQQFKKGCSPELTPCVQIWDYINVLDVARAFLLIAEKGRDGMMYPLGSGYGRPLREYVEEIRDIIAPEVNVNFGAKEYYPHQPMYLVSDNSRLMADTGFVPEVKFFESINCLLIDN